MNSIEEENPQVALAAFEELLDTARNMATRYAAAEGLDGLGVQGIEFTADILRAALMLKHVNNDPDRPIWTPLTDRIQKWAWEHPFTRYDLAPISGTGTYRISGVRNDSRYLGISVYGGGVEREGGMATAIVASRPDRDLEFGDDGSFEVVLSAQEHPGNWLRLDPDASSVVVRQYFSDPIKDVPGHYTIERIDTPPSPATRRGPEDVARLFRATTRFLAETDTIQQALLDVARNETFNEFLPPADRTAFVTSTDGELGTDERPGGYMYGTADNVYTFGRYRLAPNEALVFEVTPMQCRYWSAHLGTIWQESPPYDEHYGLLDARTATLDENGALRVVISERDPGVPNWLPTSGHHLGVMLLRYLLPEPGEQVPVPVCRVVEIDDISTLV